VMFCEIIRKIACVQWNEVRIQIDLVFIIGLLLESLPINSDGCSAVWQIESLSCSTQS
jgi:hypothetical protein